MAVDTAAYLVEYFDGGWLTIPAGKVADVRLQAASATGDHPLAFGDSATAGATVQLTPDALTADLARDMPIRVRYTRAASQAYGFRGLVDRCDRSLDDLTVACLAYTDLVQRTKAYSPAFYRRPVATVTTVSSVEDPASSSYQGGLINWVLWQAGGRPAAQDFSYPNAPFYYSCDQALLAPTWSWVNGDDGLAACRELAAASGGQIYQTLDGVLRFRQPLLFAAGTQVFTFTRATYNAARYTTPTGNVADVYVCEYIPRVARAMQEIYNDQPARVVLAGETATIDLAPQYPLKSLETAPGSTNTLRTEALNIAFFDGAPVAQANPGGYVHSVSVAAQRVRLTVGNYSNRPFVIHRIILRGEPIVAGETGIVRIGSGPTERQVPNNLNIQSRSQAERLCLLYSLYGTARRVVTLSGCAYDPARLLGERVGLTVPEWSYTNRAHIVIGIQIDETGGTATYTLADATGLPTASNYFLIGTQNESGNTKQVGV